EGGGGGGVPGGLGGALAEARALRRRPRRGPRARRVELAGARAVPLVRAAAGLRRLREGVDLRALHRPALHRARARHPALPLRRLPGGSRGALASVASRVARKMISVYISAPAAVEVP